MNITSAVSLFEFKSISEANSWRIVNDGVMGGISDSQIAWNEKDETLIFSGNVSLENNGGFASIRTVPQKFDATDFSKVKIRVKGDGKIYKLRLRNSNQFDGIVFSKNFETQKDKWVEIEMNVEDFQPTFRGRIYPKYGQLNPNELQQVGFLIADKQVGKFHLEIDWIRVSK